jgi:hypothetical protein
LVSTADFVARRSKAVDWVAILSWTLAVNRLQVVADGASNRPDPGLWWTIGALKWIRRLVSGAVLRLPVSPECRDLIGARSDLTRHSSVRSPRRRANY